MNNTLFDDAFSLCSQCFSVPLTWLQQIFNAIPKSAGMFLACFSVLLVSMVFIRPLRGSGFGFSDKVKKASRGLRQVNTDSDPDREVASDD